MSQMNKTDMPRVRPLMKPIQYAEERLVISILSGHYAPGSHLPGERELAKELGVTRQTLREALQRLAKDRWITVQHGKPTTVNHYKQEGGLGILQTLAAYPEYLPEEFITEIMGARVLFMPPCAQCAVDREPGVILDFLEKSRSLADQTQDFADYDRRLHELMVKQCDNMVFRLLFNDFSSVVDLLGPVYFSLPQGRMASGGYYTALQQAILNKQTVEGIVRGAMTECLHIWRNDKIHNIGDHHEP